MSEVLNASEQASQQAWMGAWNPADALPEAFLALPAQIYADDPYWLGENSEQLRQQFSSSNSWFEKGRAWLGVIPGAARLAGFVQDQDIDGERVAFFGFWESSEQLPANRTLFDGLQQWAREQGATRLYGPINFTTFGHYRIRLDGFDHPPFPGEPWNPVYYPRLMGELGLNTHYRYISTFNTTPEILTTVKPDYLRVKPKLEQAVAMEAMTAEFWMQNLDELYGFVDQVFGGNFGYTAISRAAFAAQCGSSFAEKFCSKTSVLARAKDGRIAGFFLTYPDYSPLLQQSNAQRLQLNDITFTAHAAQLPSPRRLLAKTGGVHPDFRAIGLFTAMSCELSLRAEGLYDIMVGALVREDNNSRQFALRHGSGGQHSYALFQVSL